MASKSTWPGFWYKRLFHKNGNEEAIFPKNRKLSRIADITVASVHLTDKLYFHKIIRKEEKGKDAQAYWIW